ncbi:MAG TPA: hypothetical protein VNW51_01220 [Mucilaginibacter sp.]|nr:hypothetical protein [Mucilaginibacter sp.]
MRKLTLFIILIFFAGVVNAQTHDRYSYSYTKLGIGVFGGMNTPYVDLKQSNKGKSFSLIGYYNITPYLPLGLEIQSGELSGGSIITDPSKRQFDNQYKAIFVHGDCSLGQILDYEDNFFLGIAKDFYMGTGVGVISNNMKFIQRYNLVTYQYPLLTYRYPGEDKSLSLAVPIRFGYEFKIYDSWGEPFIGINIQYVHTIAFNDELDGYNDPSTIFKNNSLDQYSLLQVGIKVNFGQSVPYTKKINY